MAPTSPVRGAPEPGIPAPPGFDVVDVFVAGVVVDVFVAGVVVDVFVAGVVVDVFVAGVVVDVVVVGGVAGQFATVGSGSSFPVLATMTTDLPWASEKVSPTNVRLSLPVSELLSTKMGFWSEGCRRSSTPGVPTYLHTYDL